MKKTLKQLLFMLILTATLLSSGKQFNTINNSSQKINVEHKGQYYIIPHSSPLDGEED